MLMLWIASLAALFVINRNLWAIAALPLIFAAGQVSIKVPRIRLALYFYNPAHLAVLWGAGAAVVGPTCVAAVPERPKPDWS